MVWLSLNTVGRYKTPEQTDVRLLGLRNSLIKLFHKEVMSQSKAEVREYLEPVQLGQSRAGAAKLVCSVGRAITVDRDYFCCRIDLSCTTRQ